MATNRRHIDRETKKAEILDVAEEMLINKGFEATTVADIAHKAGVSNNAVYWYYPSKDDIFAAVLRRRHERAREYQDKSSDIPFAERALSTLKKLDTTAALTAAVHERAKYSDAVAQIHREFHADIDQQIRIGLNKMGVSEHDSEMAAAVIVAMVEGIHLHGDKRDSQARDDMVLWVIQNLIRKK